MKKRKKSLGKRKTDGSLPGGLPDEYQAFLYGFIATEIQYGIPWEEEVKLKVAKRKIQKVKGKKVIIKETHRR